MHISYKLRITEKANEDVENIFAYLSRERPSAAAKFIEAFEDNTKRLRWLPARFPKIREGFRSRRTYRHLLFHPYRIIYRVQHRDVFILRVIHQAQFLREIE